MVPTLVRLHDWITSIQSGAKLLAPRKNSVSGAGPDPMQQIAESLATGSGTDRQLLLKSIQETLFYCVGIEAELTAAQIETRLKRFLDRETKYPMLQVFLSLYFFNYVWFHTCERFRPQALNSKAFDNDLLEVENICQRIVFAALRPLEQVDRTLDRPALEELVRSIEQRLRGN